MYGVFFLKIVIFVANLTFSHKVAFFTLDILHKFWWHFIFSKKTIFRRDYLDQLKAGEGGVH